MLTYTLPHRDFKYFKFQLLYLLIDQRTISIIFRWSWKLALGLGVIPGLNLFAR